MASFTIYKNGNDNMNTEDLDFEEQCKHREECQASFRILFHKDECEHCDIAEKFKPKVIA